MGALAVIMGYLPAIIETITTGADLLAKWNALKDKAGPDGTGVTDAELAQFAAEMEAALAESQAALRG